MGFRGLNVTPKVHRAIDMAAGLLIGWYRIRVAEPQPERNSNANYVLPKEEVNRRIAAARIAPATMSKRVAIYSVAELVKGIERPTICDFGGSYGEDCIRFQRYIPNASYTVVEIPEIVAIAKQAEALPDIKFSTTLPAGCDVFHSSGVVMNAHVPVLNAIKSVKPPRLVITSVEITESPTYWSMVVYRKFGRRHPYITFNRQEFLDRFMSLGYTLKDSWHQGESNSGVFLNGQKQPDIFGFTFLRNDLVQ